MLVVFSCQKDACPIIYSHLYFMLIQRFLVSYFNLLCVQVIRHNNSCQTAILVRMFYLEQMRIIVSTVNLE